MKIFDFNINSPASAYTKSWELIIGSCHATTALREDYRKQLEKCQRELGFKYVRFHGLFDDDMSVLTFQLMKGGTMLSFTNIDSIFDYLLSINMKPFIELGFMPECLKSSNSTVFHYKGNTSPPKSYDAWSGFITQFTQHLIDRYGRDEVRQWYFEVWNEPNLGGPDSPFGFWSGTQKDYFELYKSTANAVKAVDERLPVGGPATSNNAWISELLDYCKADNVPIDFVSTHHYPTDVVLGFGVEDSANFTCPIDLSNPQKLAEILKDKDKTSKAMAEYSVFKDELWRHVDRGVLTEMAAKVKQQAGSLPVYYTEWNSLAGIASDGPFGSSFIAKTVLDNNNLVDGYSYWTFSDIFEEQAMPSAEFHGGFGLLTLHDIPKASYRAFELLHKLGNMQHKSSFREGTVDIYAFSNPDNFTLQILIVNHHSLLHDIETESLCINISGIKKSVSSLQFDIQRIDDDNANAYKQWELLGKPEYPTKAQMCHLMAASQINTEHKTVLCNASIAKIDIDIPPMGIALLTLYL